MQATRELEICAETLQACQAASDGGADRIELCSALSEGGVTPSLGLLQEVIGTVKLPIHVLLRPRGGDFVYSDSELRVMCADVKHAVRAGAAGIVVGMLTPDNAIDLHGITQILQRANGLPVTFHRAFDQTSDLAQSLEVLIDLGCSRILTSGGKPTVVEGRETLEALAAVASGRIRIAAGGGVTLGNAVALTAIRGLDLHASLRPKTEAPSGDPLWHQATAPISVDAVRTLAGIVHADS